MGPSFKRAKEPKSSLVLQFLIWGILLAAGARRARND